jgi:hypothetical protein
MVAYFPSNDGGIGGRGRNATEEGYALVDELTRHYYHGGTNVLAANIKTHTQPHRSTGHLAGTILRHRTQRRHDSQAYLHEPSVGLSTSTPRSPWDEDQALRSFRAQHRQFDRGSRDPLVLQEAQQQLPPSPGYPRRQSRTTTSRAS